MNLRRLYLIGIGAIVVQLLFTAWGFAQVGFDAQVPTHWGADGQVNGYGAAWWGFTLAPAISAGLLLMFGAIPRIEPRRENLRLSASAYRQIGVATVALMTLLQAGLILAGTGREVPMTLLIGIGIGGLFMVLGNVLGTVRSNYMVGVRTPWTLTSELAWEKTHRLVGRLFFLCGLGMIVVSLIADPVWLLAWITGTVVAILVAAFGYSYRVWKSDPDKRSIGGGDAP